MKKKIVFGLLLALPMFFIACGGENTNTNKTTPSDENKEQAATEESADAVTYDPRRGEGKFDSSNLQIKGLDAAMASKGKAISDTKCMSCHKVTDEMLVGPGWKGVTNRHTPYWLMNFITNPDPMIDKDPKVQQQLEVCLVRMPNQNLADEEARAILEYMRKNDGAK
ncbi:MAG: c-type cytochrome [Chitinophagaceae bacterium]|nr:c-type cytochrome [Chitinophagaceae bacterium]MCW5905149.1 c-type cytochrome [Chitinophagaceae bacterium]